MKLLVLSAACLLSMGVAHAQDSQAMYDMDQLNTADLSQPVTAEDYNADGSLLLDSVMRPGPGGHMGGGGFRPGPGYRPGPVFRPAGDRPERSDRRDYAAGRLVDQKLAGR